MLARAGWFDVFGTKRLELHLMRCVLNVLSLFIFFEALRRLELATLFAIGFVGPLFMTALSVPMLGEKVGVHRWAAIGVGMIGALVIVDPVAAQFDIAMLFALSSTLLWSAAMVIVRKLSSTEKDLTLIVYVNTALLIVGVIGAPFEWRPVGARDLGFIVALALLLVVGQWLMVRAFRLAPVGVVAPFQYTGIIWATLIGWFFWNEFPANHVWLGAAILIASGLYVMWRESVRAREKAAKQEN
jgi:drug/metabolite transporter (DMT)-like permease